MLTIQFLCPLPNGLHARPAWELKEQCSQWQSEVIFLNHRQNAGGCEKLAGADRYRNAV